MNGKTAKILRKFNTSVLGTLTRVQRSQIKRHWLGMNHLQRSAHRFDMQKHLNQQDAMVKDLIAKISGTAKDASYIGSPS